jgi:iron complex outermembrane recepter protein
LLTGTLLAACANPVAAQRSQENAATAAGDAFGKAVGNERVGLYTVDDIRGFNPIDAGNARIEGLFFDQQDRPTPRLISGSTIRVGITAQNYPFPAPTGIVDYRLRPLTKTPQGSIDFDISSSGGRSVTIEASLPIIGDKFGITAGAAAREFIQPQGDRFFVRSFATSLVWHPVGRATVSAFASGIEGSGNRVGPVIFPAGNFLPPRIERSRPIGQAWTQRNNSSRLFGATLLLPIGPVRLESGLFKSRREADISFSDLLRGTLPTGVVTNRVIIADANNLDDSLSGEARLVHDWRSGDIQHHVYATIRGRSKQRRFGGARTVFSGGSTVAAVEITRPAISFGVDDRDQVRQITYGLGYGAEWARRGSITLSLAKSNYSKTTTFANPALAQQRLNDNPLLYSANASIIVTKRFALYGGFVRGLEESLSAPEIAVNRGESPPAILTRQVDAGVRYTITPDLSLVAGVFSVKKPYFNLDAGLRFGQLGVIENRGVELSLAGRVAPGVSVVAGTVFLDPRISGVAVTSGRIGSRPVGSVTRRSTLTLDWKPEGQKAWSFDGAIESTSERTANLSNALRVPARATLALGTRYRFSLGKTPVLLRVLVNNVFNEYGYLVSSSGGFTASAERAVTGQLIFDL